MPQGLGARRWRVGGRFLRNRQRVAITITRFHVEAQATVIIIFQFRRHDTTIPQYIVTKPSARLADHTKQTSLCEIFGPKEW